ncbi:MAG TPA: hypothetical protein PL077_03015 [Treponemataceae bacterium]|nr:hypothetical protein [Treponemataceae bacterium]
MNYIDVLCALCIASIALPPLASRGFLVSKREAAAAIRAKTLCALAAEKRLFESDCESGTPEAALSRWPQASFEIEVVNGKTLRYLRIEALGRPWYFPGETATADD